MNRSSLEQHGAKTATGTTVAVYVEILHSAPLTLMHLQATLPHPHLLGAIACGSKRCCRALQVSLECCNARCPALIKLGAERLDLSTVLGMLSKV